MWQAIAAIGAPLVAGIIGALLRRTGAPIRLKAHAELLADVKGTAAEAELVGLIEDEVKELRERHRVRAGRELQSGGVVLMILLLVIFSVSAYAITNWIIAWAHDPFQWVAVTVAVLVALIGIVLIAAAWTAIWKTKPVV